MLGVIGGVVKPPSKDDVIAFLGYRVRLAKKIAFVPKICSRCGKKIVRPNFDFTTRIPKSIARAGRLPPMCSKRSEAIFTSLRHVRFTHWSCESRIIGHVFGAKERTRFLAKITKE